MFFVGEIVGGWGKNFEIIKAPAIRTKSPTAIIGIIGAQSTPFSHSR